MRPLYRSSDERLRLERHHECAAMRLSTMSRYLSLGGRRGRELSLAGRNLQHGGGVRALAKLPCWGIYKAKTRPAEEWCWCLKDSDFEYRPGSHALALPVTLVRPLFRRSNSTSIRLVPPTPCSMFCFCIFSCEETLSTLQVTGPV